MIIEIRSEEPVSYLHLKKIQYIFNEKLYPVESLRSSIPNFKSFDGERIVKLGDKTNFIELIEVDDR